MSEYSAFIDRKSQSTSDGGFAPLWMPDFLFDFQQHLVDWALRKGRGAIFADTGLGKTPMQLVWAENVVRHTNKPVLILTPLAVGSQTKAEGEKFGIECTVTRDGTIGKPGIYITNYERLHLFDPTNLNIACDESSILKHFSGATQQAVTRFMNKMDYRLLCTATAAPNDYHELGTSSQALGYLGYSDMLTRFFVMEDKKRHRMNDVKLSRGANTGNHYAKLAYRVSQQIGMWRMKGHAEEHFWKWVCSWARACRMPSDLGYDDARFILPKLNERHHVITPNTPPDGMLFTLPAFGLKEELAERRRTTQERCETAARLVDHDQPAVIWCHLNPEGDLLQKLIPGSVQVKGAMTDEQKLVAYDAFRTGEKRVMIIKPKIGAWGLNWQHCAHVVTFVSHSYEQYYQSVRRCYRYGQERSVTVDIIASEGEDYVRANMQRKAESSKKMFARLVEHMNDALSLVSTPGTDDVSVPPWIR